MDSLSECEASCACSTQPEGCATRDVNSLPNHKAEERSFDGRAVGLGFLVIILVSSGSVAATPQGARESITSDDLKRHVNFLASDTLEGRAAGSQGGRAAAAYLALELAKSGLKPGAEENDFLQEFKGGFQNLLAVVPGSDPQLADEVIVVSGHFDHVGLGNRGNSFGPYGQIHNGADDNASGTAAVLEVAEAVASLDEPPRRTVLFALWDAEEGGMIGSKHWLKNPSVPLDNVRLMMNCDMVGRLRNNTLVVYGARTAAGLRQRVTEANVESNLRLKFEWRQRDDSDHWPFYRQGIPYVMLHTGDHNDYHRPSDDPDKVNYDGLEVLSQMMFEFVREAANADELPPFREQSREERRWHQQQAEIVPAAPAATVRLELEQRPSTGGIVPGRAGDTGVTRRQSRNPSEGSHRCVRGRPRISNR